MHCKTFKERKEHARKNPELKKIYGHSLTAKKPSLQQQNDKATGYMNSKIKGYGFDLN